jgi:hypothetical protein
MSEIGAPRTLFKHLMAICFSTDRLKAVTPRVLIMVNYLLCPFEIDQIIKSCSHLLSTFWLFGEDVFSEYGYS